MTALHFLFQYIGPILLMPRAYIDPNTGGMLFQMLAVVLALFSGIVFFFSRQIKMMVAKIRRKISKEQPEEIENNPEDPKL